MKTLVILILSVCACATPRLLLAQSSINTSSQWYLEIDALTTETHPAFHTSLHTHPRFELRETCVPAHVAVIGLRSGVTSSASDYSELCQLLSSAGFKKVRPLENPGAETFMTRCTNARYGR
jgi:hypothetical protein